jgi:hypothetical protein
MSAMPRYCVGKADGERWNNEAADELGFLEEHWWCHVRTLRHPFLLSSFPHCRQSDGWRQCAYRKDIAADAIDGKSTRVKSQRKHGYPHLSQHRSTSCHAHSQSSNLVELHVSPTLRLIAGYKYECHTNPSTTAFWHASRPYGYLTLRLAAFLTRSRVSR